MKIWLINHYAVPPQYYPLARPSQFAKYFIKMGHEVTIIAASTAHNSDINLIEGKEKIKIIEDDGIPYVLIKCSQYKGNGIRRVINILEFARKLPAVLDSLEKPDVIMATSFDPLTCYVGIKYAKRHGLKAVAEIADLWPETLVAYNGISPKNPVVKALRRIEKKIYTGANAIVFTMEGAYDYIIDQGWESDVPREKVSCINNGINIEQFEYNREQYRLEDPDLEDDEAFKIVYTGSIRRVNNVGKILDIAKHFQNQNTKFLIYGSGDEIDFLKQRLIDEKIENVFFKGYIEKKYIPYIISKANLNILDMQESIYIFKYGISPNKLFEYFAAKKPILMYQLPDYNPALNYRVGFVANNMDEIIDIIDGVIRKKTEYLISEDCFDAACNAYSYEKLAKECLTVLEEC